MVARALAAEEPGPVGLPFGVDRLETDQQYTRALWGVPITPGQTVPPCGGGAWDDMCRALAERDGAPPEPAIF